MIRIPGVVFCYYGYVDTTKTKKKRALCTGESILCTIKRGPSKHYYGTYLLQLSSFPWLTHRTVAGSNIAVDVKVDDLSVPDPRGDGEKVEARVESRSATRKRP